MKLHLAGVAALTMVAGGLLGAPASAAITSTEVVTPSDVTVSNNWVTFTRDTGTYSFQQGPGTPPAGTGSLQLSTPASNDKVYLFNYDRSGTALAALDELRYSTYRTAGQLQQVAAINLEVDVNGSAPGGFTTLVFEPVYNTDQGPVVNDSWQSWDAFNGGAARWWSSNPIPGAPNRDTFVPLSLIRSMNPDAVMMGVGMNQGGGNPTLVTNVDRLIVGASGSSTLYDFELVRDSDGDGVEDSSDNCPSTANPNQEDADLDGIGSACDNPEFPTTTDQCKNGGWATFTGPFIFKNQGDCVSYVATAGKKPAA